MTVDRIANIEKCIAGWTNVSDALLERVEAYCAALKSIEQDGNPVGEMAVEIIEMMEAAEKASLRAWSLQKVAAKGAAVPTPEAPA